jgi:hypothetical protein
LKAGIPQRKRMKVCKSKNKIRPSSSSGFKNSHKQSAILKTHSFKTKKPKNENEKPPS